MTHDEMIAVIEAHKRGETLQFRLQNHEINQDDWDDVCDPGFNFSALDYRIKPAERKPREWWIYPNEETDPQGFAIGKILRKESCMHGFGIHVREVLE